MNIPKNSHYVFTNDDGKKVDLNITWEEEIETRDMYSNLSDLMKQQFDAMNISPKYIRYYAKEEVVFTDLSSNTEVKSSGDMIYEYAYIGKPDERAHV